MDFNLPILDTRPQKHQAQSELELAQNNQLIKQPI
jgi:hypothetical protein